MEEEYKYNCIECNYHNNNIKYWNRHIKTKKHIKNTNTEIVVSNYNCNLCNYHSDNKAAWYQHKNRWFVLMPA